MGIFNSLNITFSVIEIGHTFLVAEVQCKEPIKAGSIHSILLPYTVWIRKPEIQIPETFKNLTFFMSGFQMVFILAWTVLYIKKKCLNTKWSRLA